MISDKMETFIPMQEIDECGAGRKNNDSLCIRFIRKKYLCIILFLLFGIVFGESFILIFQKLDENILETVLQLMLGNNSILVSSNNTFARLLNVAEKIQQNGNNSTE